MICGTSIFSALVLTTLTAHIALATGQHSHSGICDENAVNIHMLGCYKEYIDDSIDATSPESAYYMDAALLCKAYNSSQSYRRCLYSIFDIGQVCSSDQYPFSYEYSKVYWKMVMSSCAATANGHCHPSRLSQQVISKCHYSFDDQYPTMCKEFLHSVQCMERYEADLITPKHGTECARNKAYYYFYGDLAARLQLATNVCEQESLP